MRSRSFAPAPAVDALLYAASAAAALLVLVLAPYARNRTWAEFAWPAYALGATASLVLAWRAVQQRRWIPYARMLIALCVLTGVVVFPLVKEVQWRAKGAHIRTAALHPYASSEVVVTEGAAAAALGGHNPYSAYFASPELAGRSRSIPEHFPYLPAMAVFGLPGALLPDSPWTDARVFFALATGLAAAAALWSWRTSPERRLRALQVLVILPLGASALVTGGDDMPVLALSLLALVLLRRGRRATPAAAVAIAALLKVTAWPLLLAFAVTVRHGGARRRLASPLLIAPLVVAAFVLAAAAVGPGAFIDDVLLFPAGLGSLPSPAASPTLGSTLVGLAGPSPSREARVAITLALLIVALLAVAVVLTRLGRARAARTDGVHEAAAAAGLILLALVVLAPVARLGYVVYPLDLLVWAALLRQVDTPSPAALPAPIGEALAA